MSALEQFPLLMSALKAELRQELLEELGQGQWLDQDQSVLGRNKHVAACKRLIREDSPDALYADGRWMLRSRAVDAEIQRRNRRMVESGKLPETLPPPAPVEAPIMPLAKAEPDPDETGIYAKGWLERMRGGR